MTILLPTTDEVETAAASSAYFAKCILAGLLEGNPQCHLNPNESLDSSALFKPLPS